MNSVQSTGHTGSMSKKDSQIEVKRKQTRKKHLFLLRISFLLSYEKK